MEKKDTRAASRKRKAEDEGEILEMAYLKMKKKCLDLDKHKVVMFNSCGIFEDGTRMDYCVLRIGQGYLPEDIAALFVEKMKPFVDNDMSKKREEASLSIMGFASAEYLWRNIDFFQKRQYNTLSNSRRLIHSKDQRRFENLKTRKEIERFFEKEDWKDSLNWLLASPVDIVNKVLFTE